MKPKIRRKGKTRVTKKYKELIGKPKNINRDKAIRALAPGKRVSANGKVHYERRANHSDLRPKKGL